MSARVHTRQTTTAHAVQDQRQRDSPRTTPSRGPKRARRGASSAPRPRQRAAEGTMSRVLSQRPRFPHSCPFNPRARAPGMGKAPRRQGKPTGAPRTTGTDEARRVTLGYEARQRGPSPAWSKALGQVPSKNGHRVQHTRQARTTRNEPRHVSSCQATQNPHTTNPSQEWQGAGQLRTQTHTANTTARNGGARPKPEPKHTNPHRTPEPGLAASTRSAHTNTHAPTTWPGLAG